MKKALNETNQVVSSAGKEGKLNSRIDTEGKVGVWMELGESINDLLNAVSKPIVRVNEIDMSFLPHDIVND